MSDALCRLEWEIRKAAANALRLHVAALPALAVALLLTRLALLLFSHRPCRPTGHSDQHHHHQQPRSNPIAALSMVQTLGVYFITNRRNWQGLHRAHLSGLSIFWALTASWLWPQLALLASWMSHRRPTLPSVLGSLFLVIMTEGILEALELSSRLLTATWRLLRSVAGRQIGKSGSRPVEPTGPPQASTCLR